MDYQKLPATYLVWIWFTFLIHKYFSIGAPTDGLSLVPKVINRSATVMVGSDVLFLGKVALSSEVSEAVAKTTWFRNANVIEQRSYGRISILDDGYTLCIKEFRHSDEATYSFHYQVNTSYIVTRFKATGIDPKLPNTDNIAGTVIGLMLIFMVVFVIIFYCCRGGIAPARPATITRHDLIMHRKASDAKKSSMHNLEAGLARLQSRCFHCLNSAVNQREQSYSNLCTESLSKNDIQRKGIDVKSRTNNNEIAMLEKPRITLSTDLPCEVHRLATDV